ncbi:MAG: hypothetical protein ACE5KE_01800 [Methanosarcinales archaeon]
MFEKGNKIRIDEKIFKSISEKEILNYVFNSDTSGEIEILRRPSNKKELAFKLKTSDKPFALIKIGDISGWLKEELVGYEIQEKFEDESYFENLNREDSEINILMGSRGFYEGWDSNRPNVINFINIGVGEDARKFILQSVGRGVRIEPIKDKRKRLLQIYNAKEISADLFNKIKDKVLPIETLFIFGTNRKALVTVVRELEREKKKEGEAQLSFFVNKESKKHKLLMPTYKLADYPLMKRKLRNFEISQKDYETLNRFLKFISDDRILLMLYNTEPEKIKILKESLSNSDYYRYVDKDLKNLDLLIQRIFDYFGVTHKEFKELKELQEEIKHFRNIKVYLKDIYEIQKKIERVVNYPKLVKELQDQYGKVSPEEYIQKVKNLSHEEVFESDHKKLRIKYIANHYYIPLILSEEEKVDYIKHIIKTPSEVRFIKDLEDYLAKSDNKFKEFDWWLFSKLDESLDEVYIPYYNPKSNRISEFYPDFIFWLMKNDNYFIVFVDPKGIQHTDWADKVNGYKYVFEENGTERNFAHNGFNAKIKLFLRTTDASIIKQRFPEYSRYWFDSIEEMLKALR